MIVQSESPVNGHPLSAAKVTKYNAESVAVGMRARFLCGVLCPIMGVGNISDGPIGPEGIQLFIYVPATPPKDSKKDDLRQAFEVLRGIVRLRLKVLEVWRVQYENTREVNYKFAVGCWDHETDQEEWRRLGAKLWGTDLEWVTEGA